ncbi:CTP synthase [Candidatus Collierbacteria bacterium]|nr:CTP synthase [Candidatus Collierbacteria bacterium]
MQTKYIFTVGGVLSGLGKGITTASIGLLLKSKGFKVTAVKIDPYISLDAGTMRPAEHGETFVTDDGGEIDQDLGNYERFLGVSLTRDNNITTGKVFQSVIHKERSFRYQGRDAEMFPDVIDDIKEKIYSRSKGFDFCLCEIGGTTGDLENLPFLHAAREIGREHQAVYVMVTYLPFLRNVGELKTKPTQHAVAALRQVGIFPDFIITRNEVPITPQCLETISQRCFVKKDNIIDNPDRECIAEIPLLFEKEKIADKILKIFRMRARKSDLASWKKYVDGLIKPVAKVRVALVGKYVKNGIHNHADVYISVLEAVKHAAAHLKLKVELVSIDSTAIEADPSILESYRGIIVPQGWGGRATEGIVHAVNFARVNKKPYLGLCFGMQLAVIEYARNKARLNDANSAEINPETPYPVIHIMKDQEKLLKEERYGGTIRLGAYPCVLQPNTLIDQAYRDYPDTVVKNSTKVLISERHRHRYEFNNSFKDALTQAGLIISGTSPDGHLVESIELPAKVHPFFVGVQFHPEFKSRPETPHPLFIAFLKSLLKPT